MKLPTYLRLTGDEDGGVTLICDHPTCEEDLAYYTSWDESQAQSLRYFESRDLDGFIAFAREHAAVHGVGAS